LYTKVKAMIVACALPCRIDSQVVALSTKDGKNSFQAEKFLVILDWHRAFVNKDLEGFQDVLKMSWLNEILRIKQCENSVRINTSNISERLYNLHISNILPGNTQWTSNDQTWQGR
jgi:hypothetical protein